MSATGADLDRLILEVLSSGRSLKAKEIALALRYAHICVDRHEVNSHLYGSLAQKVEQDAQYRWRATVIAKPSTLQPRPLVSQMPAMRSQDEEPIAKPAPVSPPPAYVAAPVRQSPARGNSGSGAALVLVVAALLACAIFSSIGSGSGATSSSTVQRSYVPGDTNGDGRVVTPETPPGANPSPEWTGQNTEWNYVAGYYRSDGTYVSGHYRRTK